jgi:hypothetical protein
MGFAGYNFAADRAWQAKNPHGRTSRINLLSAPRHGAASLPRGADRTRRPADRNNARIHAVALAVGCFSDFPRLHSSPVSVTPATGEI